MYAKRDECATILDGIGIASSPGLRPACRGLYADSVIDVHAHGVPGSWKDESWLTLLGYQPVFRVEWR